jgi:hypothetical protein
MLGMDNWKHETHIMVRHGLERHLALTMTAANQEQYGVLEAICTRYL